LPGSTVEKMVMVLSTAGRGKTQQTAPHTAPTEKNEKKHCDDHPFKKKHRRLKEENGQEEKKKKKG